MIANVYVYVLMMIVAIAVALLVRKVWYLSGRARERERDRNNKKFPSTIQCKIEWSPTPNSKMQLRHTEKPYLLCEWEREGSTCPYRRRVSFAWAVVEEAGSVLISPQDHFLACKINRKIQSYSSISRILQNIHRYNTHWISNIRVWKYLPKFFCSFLSKQKAPEGIVRK
jgi:hypothetical protein